MYFDVMVKMVLLMVVVEMVVKMFVVTMVVKVVAGGSYIGSVHNVCGVTVLLMMLMVWWL